MRILHVIPWLAERYGGPAVLVPQVAVALSRRGHQVQIVTTTKDRHDRLDVPTGREIDWHGAPTTFHPLSSPRSFAASWPLLRDLINRAGDFDLIHINYLYRFHGIAAAIAALSAGTPYVVQPHGSLDSWTRGRKRHAKGIYHFLVEDRIINKASAMIATSQMERQGIRSLGYKVPVFEIPCGIDAETLRVPAPTELLAVRGVPQDRQVVTFLGRIARGKGVDILLEAFGEVAVRNEQAVLVIAGPDDEGLQQQLSSRACQLGVSTRVVFTGTVSGAEKRALLQASTAILLPSVGESFGMAAAEAMAVGCPVIVSPGVAIAADIASHGAGLVVPRDAPSIAHAIETILSNPAIATRLGAAAMALVDTHYAWDVVAAATEAAYMRIIAGHRGAESVRVHE